ncbi:hypothetical protein FRB95_011711 [Tulasnella sp. JGI-2019a]|nr:hypothetical protein FRB95_011711 [Tulasnella sp. JGI-2019a]
MRLAFSIFLLPVTLITGGFTTLYTLRTQAWSTLLGPDPKSRPGLLKANPTELLDVTYSALKEIRSDSDKELALWAKGMRILCWDWDIPVQDPLDQNGPPTSMQNNSSPLCEEDSMPTSIIYEYEKKYGPKDWTPNIGMPPPKSQEMVDEIAAWLESSSSNTAPAMFLMQRGLYTKHLRYPSVPQGWGGSPKIFMLPSFWAKLLIKSFDRAAKKDIVTLILGMDLQKLQLGVLLNPTARAITPDWIDWRTDAARMPVGRRKFQDVIIESILERLLNESGVFALEQITLLNEAVVLGSNSQAWIEVIICLFSPLLS